MEPAKSSGGGGGGGGGSVSSSNIANTPDNAAADRERDRDRSITWASGFRSSVGHLTQLPLWSPELKSRLSDPKNNSDSPVPIKPTGLTALSNDGFGDGSAQYGNGGPAAAYKNMQFAAGAGYMPSLSQAFAAGSSGSSSSSSTFSFVPPSTTEENSSEVRLLKLQLEQSRQNEQLIYQQFLALERKHEELRLKYHKLKVKLITLERDNRKPSAIPRDLISSIDFDVQDKSGSSTPSTVITPPAAEVAFKYGIAKKKPSIMLESTPFIMVAPATPLNASVNQVNPSSIMSPTIDNKPPNVPPTEVLLPIPTHSSPAAGASFVRSSTILASHQLHQRRNREQDHLENEISTELSSESEEELEYNVSAVAAPVESKVFVNNGAAPSREVCRHFLKGKCRFKKDCKFSHSVEHCPYCGEKPPSGKIAASAHLARCWKSNQQKLGNISD